MATTDEIENTEEEEVIASPVLDPLEKLDLVVEADPATQGDLNPLIEESVDEDLFLIEEPVTKEDPLVADMSSVESDPFGDAVFEKEEDDITTALLEDTKQDRVDFLNQQSAEAAANFVPDPNYEFGKTPTETETDDDPLLLKVFKNIGEVPEQVYGGVALALNNTANAIDELGEVLYDNIPMPVQEAMKTSPVAPFAYYLQHAKETNPAQLPVPDADTVVGQVTQSISQFVVGFIPVLRGTKLITGGAKAMNWFGRAAQATAAGAVTDYFVWDPHEERLANMLNELEIAGVPLKNPVLDYLQQDDSDGAIESRLKTMVEGAMFGVIAEPAMAVFGKTLMSSLRFLKIAKSKAGLASRTDPINNDLNVYYNGVEGEASLELINNDSARYVLHPGKYFDYKNAEMQDEMFKGLDGDPDLDPAVLQRALDGDSDALNNPVINEWLLQNNYEGHWRKVIDGVGPKVPGTEATSPEVSAGFVPTTPFTRTYKAPNSVIGMSDDQIEEAVEASKAGHAADIRRVFDPDTAEKVIKLDQRNSDSALRELELMDMTEDQSFVIYGNRDIEGDSLTYEDLDQLLTTSRNSIYSPEIKNAEIFLDLQRALLDLKPEQFSLIRDGGGDVSEQGLFIQMVKAMDELMQRGLSKDQIDRGVIGAARKRGIEDNDIEFMFADFLGEWTKPQPRTVRESAPMIEPPVREEPVGASDGTDVVGPPAARRHVKVYDPTKLSVAPQETTFQIYRMLGDKKRGIVEKDVVTKYLKGEIDRHEFLNSVNFAALDGNKSIREMAEQFNGNMTDTPEFTEAFAKAMEVDHNSLKEINVERLIEIDKTNGTRLQRDLRDGDRVFEISQGEDSVGALIVKQPNAEGVAEASWRGVGEVGQRQMHILLRQIKHQMPELKRIEGKSLGGRSRNLNEADTSPRGWDIDEEVGDMPQNPISMEEMEKTAKRLGVTPEEAMGYVPGSAKERGFEMAVSMLYDAAEMMQRSIADEVTRLSRDPNLPGPDIQLVYEGNRMLNIQQGLGEALKNIGSEWGRTGRGIRFGQEGRKAKIKAGDEYINKRIMQKFTPLEGSQQEIKEQIDAAIINEGSLDQAIRLMQAISDGLPEDVVKVMRLGTTTKRIQDMIVEMWYFGWLSSVPLHAGNIFGNSINVLYQIPERALAEQIGAARQALGRGSPEDAVVSGEASAMLQGYATFIKEAMSAAGKTFKTGITTHQKLDQKVKRAWSAEAWDLQKSDKAFAKPLGNTLNGIGKVFNVTSLILSTADEFFGVWAFKANMTALGHREATKLGLTGKAYADKVDSVIRNPTAIQREESSKFAHALTLTTPLGSTGKKMQAVLNANPIVGKSIVPFFKTPTNIIKFAGVRTPLGFFAKSVREDIAKGGAAGDLALARITLGTGIAFTIANEVWSDRVTGAGPSHPGLRQNWLLTHQPFSMLIGDTWVSYDRADPIGIVFGIAASAAEMQGNMKDDDSLDLSTAIALAISKSLVSKTWLNGFSQTLDAFTSGSEDKLQRLFGKLAGNFVPGSGLVNTIRGEVDPIWRDSEEWYEVVRSRTPGFSDELPANKNYWGEDIVHAVIGFKFLSPLFTMKANAPPASDWLWENKVTIRPIVQTQSFPSRYGTATIELTSHEHAKLKELSGNGWKDPRTGLGFLDTMNAIIEGNHNISSEWNRATDGPDGVKALIFRNLQSYFRKGARQRLLLESEELQNRVNVQGKAAFEALTIGPQI